MIILHIVVVKSKCEMILMNAVLGGKIKMI